MDAKQILLTVYLASVTPACATVTSMAPVSYTHLCYGMFHSLQVPEVLSLRATDGGLSSVHPQIRTACSCAGYEGLSLIHI